MTVNDFTDIATLAPGSSSHQDQGLDPGEDYEYRLLAVVVVGSENGQRSSTASSPALIESTVPLAPTLSATLGTYDDYEGDAVLTWTSNSAGYYPTFEYSRDGITWTEATGTPPNDLPAQPVPLGNTYMTFWPLFGATVPKQEILPVYGTMYFRMCPDPNLGASWIYRLLKVTCAAGTTLAACLAFHFSANSFGV